MSDWFFRQGGRDKLVNWLGLDSWIDSSLAETWAKLRDYWEAGTSYFARFRLSGWKRLLNELFSEALTIGTGALIVMYALALPAFQEVDEGKWLSTGKYSVTFLDRHGTEIGKRGMNLNDAVPLEEIPEIVVKAALATEDRRFFEHFGVDFLGTFRALLANASAGETVQGGSTITQQLAKNLFLSSERSIQRKIKELFLAFWLEARLTKREILKLYLDRAYMGGGAFGVEAAAQYYFGKSIREVTMSEGAMLAGLFKAPTKYAPHVNLPASRARTSEVLSNLVEAGFYTAGQVHQARLNPARFVETRRPYSPDWFLDWAFEDIQRVMDGRNVFVLTARTTIDLTLQQQAEAALTSTVRQHGRQHNARSGAMVVMEPNGAVRAIVGGMDYGESQFNRATAARRQPGSSFKPYVFIAALEDGMTPNSTVTDSSRSCGNWTPKNYSGGWSGRRLTLTEALARSLNTVAAELSFKVGREKVLDTVEKLGIRGVKKTCSMALGDAGITPLEHTAGYAAFANGGKKAVPFAVIEAFSSKGDLVYSHETELEAAPPPQLFARRSVEHLNQMMQAVVTQGTGKKAALEFTHVAGKTGTSSSYRDAWFVGYTGQYVTGVWIGNDDYRPMSNVTGGSLPAQAWQGFMSVAHTSMNIPQIPGLPLHPTQVAEQARLAELKRTEPSLAAALSAQASQQKRNTIMPDQTREALKRLATTMRKAGGLPAAEEPAKGARPAADRRADLPPGVGALPAQR